MFSSVSLTAFLLLAVGVAAHPVVVRGPPVTLAMTKLLTSASAKDIVKRDQANAKRKILGDAIENGIRSRDEFDSAGVSNFGNGYAASVGIGFPPTYYNLYIDTGSANTWVGNGEKPYVKTITSEETGETVYSSYGTGWVNGTEYYDLVTLSPELVILGQSIGAASTSAGFTNYHGFLGIGPFGLTRNTLSPDKNSTIPTVTDNLFSQGMIEADLVALSFEPTDTYPNYNGEMTFGSIDDSKFTGEITYIPRTKTSRSNQYWGIDQSITYGSSRTTILPTAAGIVDSGCTLILIADDAFERYKSVTGAVLDEKLGWLKITKAQYGNLQSLYFTAGGTTFELIANAQIWPRPLNTAIGGTTDAIYLIINGLGVTPPSYLAGINFLIGYSYLERFYVVFDSGTGAVGLANTPYTMATTN